MKAILGIFAFAILQSVSFAESVTNIPATNQVILALGDWTPSPADAHRSLMAIQSFLEHPDKLDDYSKADAKDILSRAKKYRVQFVGMIRNGKKMMWCNFFPAPYGGGDRFPHWEERKVKMYDGGFAYWHIDYDPGTDKCSEFESNGVA